MKFKAKEIFADYDENNVLVIAFSGVANEHVLKTTIDE